MKYTPTVADNRTRFQRIFVYFCKRIELGKCIVIKCLVIILFSVLSVEATGEESTIGFSERCTVLLDEFPNEKGDAVDEILCFASS